MSTMKTDSRAGARFFHWNGRSAPMFQAERLLEAQSVNTVVIIASALTEVAIPGFLVEGNRPSIVLTDFEPYSPATPALSDLIHCRQKATTQTLALQIRVDGNGIETRECGSRWIKHQRVSGEIAAAHRNDKRNLRGREEVPQTSAR